jgi:hypothetical protein
MRVQLRITKGGTAIFADAYDVSDADSFGASCADAWSKLRQRQLDKETSIGALMEHLDNTVLAQLYGAHISVEPAEIE